MKLCKQQQLGFDLKQAFVKVDFLFSNDNKKYNERFIVKVHLRIKNHKVISSLQWL